MNTMYTPDVPKHIAALKAYIPGLPIGDLARRLSMPEGEIAKLASNENPLGASPKAAQAILDAGADLSLYPDNDCTELVAALAAALDVPGDWLLVGAGSESILGIAAAMLLGPGRSAVYSEYSFQAFVNAVQKAGARGIVVGSPDFHVDLDRLLGAIDTDTKLIYIANPGNPTGTRLPPEAVEAFLRQVPPNVIVLLDEAYREYLSEQEAGDSVGWVKNYPNLLVTRTFSKAYGLAGLRIGYAYAQPGLLAMLKRMRAPFSVTQIAQVAAIAALQDREFLSRTAKANAEGREQLAAGFGLLGLKYVPSNANFLLVEVGDGADMARRLETHGLIVRPVGAYGLPEWLRISVGSRHNNQRLLAALEAELRGMAPRPRGLHETAR